MYYRLVRPAGSQAVSNGEENGIARLSDVEGREGKGGLGGRLQERSRLKTIEKMDETIAGEGKGGKGKQLASRSRLKVREGMKKSLSNSS